MRLLPIVSTLLLILAVVRGFNEVEREETSNDFDSIDLPDLPTTGPADFTSSTTPEGPGEIGIFDPLPYPVIESYPQSLQLNVGDMAEFECKASDHADHMPNWPKHELFIEMFYEDDPKRDLTAVEHDWFEDVTKSTKSRPSHPKGRIDITEVAEIYLSKDAVTKEDEGWYRCRACIYKGDPENEACDKNYAKFYLRVKNEPGWQADEAESATTSTPYYQQPGAVTFRESPRSSCQVFGDPHVITYDDMVYNMPSTSCDYVLSLDQGAASFFVYGRMRPCGNLVEGNCLESVTVYAKRDAIQLQRGWLVNHRGQKVETMRTSGPIEVGVFEVEFTGTTLEARVLLSEDQNEQDWLKIRWDGFMTLTIEVPQSTKTQGLCGNNNQDPIDDFDLWGQFNDNLILFAESMKVDRNWRCGAGSPAPSMDEVRGLCGDKKYGKAAIRCNKIFAIHSFENCVHDKRPYVDACIYDQCKGINIQNDLYDWMIIPKVDRVLPPGCNAAEAYAMKCSRKSWTKDGEIIAEIDMSEWEADLRTSNSCPSRAVKLDNIPKMGCPQSWMQY